MNKKNKLFFYISIISVTMSMVLLGFLFIKFIQDGFDSSVSLFNFAFSHGYGLVEITSLILTGTAILFALIPLFLKRVLKQKQWY